MVRRRLFLPVLAASLATGLGMGGVAAAQDRPGMFLDPQLLPPDTRPGECVTRRVTGPGGAYRWERIECDPQAGWSDFDRWGYGRRPLEVEDRPLRGDRYGGWSQGGGDYGRGYGARDDGGRYDAAYPIYRVAGRDADGFLVWPGKLP
uniref:Secreted protein n=1 Tax=Caulobacter sp. (strain K31) TaxID=366602 RepID=B0T205_CAUSK